MRVDVSEIKTFRQCPRKWQFTSRNQMHLRPVVTPRHFTFGTIFHEALHQLYLGADPDKVLEWVKQQSDVANNPGEAALQSMVCGYVDPETGPLESDLRRYEILEIEHHFEEQLTRDTKICGSIDMIAIEKDTGLLFGFEHKTCKNFRTGAYLVLDDQLRVYNWELYKLSARLPSKPAVGGVILNETRKLLRKFENRRQVHDESISDLIDYVQSLSEIVSSMESKTRRGYFPQPCADYMHCQLCEYATICETYGTGRLPSEAHILDEFALEFQKRECDHLDEKVEREVMK